MHNTNRKKIAVVVTLLCTFSSVAAFAKDGERRITIQQDVSSAELVKLSVASGDVDVVGTSGKNVTAEVSATCQDNDREACDKLLKQLDWSKQTGSVAEFMLLPSEIGNYNHISMKIKFSVPQDKKLEVNLSAGQLNISGTSGCILADLNAGQINITLKESQLASAALSAKVGDANLVFASGDAMVGQRSLLVGAKLDWTKGTGSCHTKASTLTGQVNLVLK